MAFLGVGIVEHVRYYTKNHDYNNDPRCGIGDQCKDVADAADTARVVAFVGYGAAAVATGLAIAFWATDTPRAQTEKHASLGLSCIPTAAGVACSGRF